MKKALLALFADSFLFFGCNNITDSSSVAPYVPNDGKAYLCVTQTSLDVAGRTVLPSIDESSVADFNFKLVGEYRGEEKILGSFENLSELSTAAIAVDSGIWDFSLFAEKAGTMLKGTISQKVISSGSNELSFSLVWDETNLSGKGNLSFTLDFSGAVNAASVSLATGELLKYDPKTAEETAISDYSEIVISCAENKASYALSDVAAGIYRVKICLYADSEKKNLINTWRELAIVTGGQESIADRLLSSLNELYTITYENMDGASVVGDGSLQENYTRFSEEILLPKLTKTGWAFSGWFTDSTFSGNPVISIPSGSTGNRQFFAKWTSASITEVTVSQENDLNLTYDDATLTFTVSGGSGLYTWSLDGVVQSASGTKYTIDTTDLVSGTYVVTVDCGGLSATASVKITVN